MAISVAVALSMACGRPPADARVAPPRVRLALTAAPEFGDVPAIVALRQLAGRGHDVQVVPYAQAELAAEALVRGDAELALGGVMTYWAVAARGAPVVTVMEQYRTAHLLVASRSIRTCADLAGRRLGVNSLTATGGVMIRRYVEEACPDARPDMLVMPGHFNRLAALRAGALDAATVLRVDAVQLLHEMPGRFSVMEDFARRWPNFVSTGVHVTRQFVLDHPQVVAEYVRACVSANRLLGSDAARLAADARAVLQVDSDLGPVAEEYVRVEAFDRDGGLTPARIAETLRFLQQAGQLSGPVDPERLVDRSFLREALARLEDQAPSSSTAEDVSQPD